MSTRWEPAFVAVSAVLGEPREESIAAIGDAGVVHAAEIVRALRSESREARARAIARSLSEVAVAIEAARLA